MKKIIFILFFSGIMVSSLFQSLDLNKPSTSQLTLSSLVNSANASSENGGECCVEIVCVTVTVCDVDENGNAYNCRSVTECEKRRKDNCYCA